ncbi:TetR/AcrR family transcriptional regulator [Phytoactinopolyspora halotolerans]|uniref:TetR/AcrR family transcriptional regulator n=1 Tax=Phytoactinopolyspora halotolerans TaxID=1981512 RepID=A0A6L9SID2_9ACTN|nr:TetR/AcrR family transcriptional regulator [Phytoactinopolyspora halotolerans]NEE04424.1 TetR/AcrR family transcriptional regulator [Phytoactinopolyspora halotolerans]
MAERGRPRRFDRAAALRQAMWLFWEHGYEGTSISDLTTAMGIKAPSLYAAFGGKDELFREAVALYRDTDGSATDRALSGEPSARAAVEAMLRGNADLHVRADRPGGCMMVLAATNCSEKNVGIRDHLAQLRRQTVAAIEARLRRAQSEAELRPDVDVSAVAAFLGTVLHGMAVEARDGASKEQLDSIVESAMTAWDALVGGPKAA